MTKKITKIKKPDEVSDERLAEIIAEINIDPMISAGSVVKAYSSGMGDVTVPGLSKLLQKKAKGITQENKLASCEEMLIGQAQALQSIFSTLSKSAIKQERMKHFETYLRFALKAQSQCRATIETLANIKNPPVVYAKQANISQGHQQINNTVTHAGKNKTHQNEVLEKQNEQRLEQGASSAAITINPSLETVEKVERPQNRRGQKDCVT